jgi:hypothetical protein
VPQYLWKVSDTKAGVRGVAKRGRGGYFAFGEVGVYVIGEVPDNESTAALSLAANVSEGLTARDRRPHDAGGIRCRNEEGHLVSRSRARRAQNGYPRPRAAEDPRAHPAAGTETRSRSKVSCRVAIRHAPPSLTRRSL